LVNYPKKPLYGFGSFETLSLFNIIGPDHTFDFDWQFHAFDNETTSALLIGHNKELNDAKTMTTF